MKQNMKTTLFVLAACYTMVSCKQNNTNTQNTQIPQVQIPDARSAHNDSIAHPVVPADAKMPDGKNIVRWPSGIIKMQGYYKDGKRQGEWQSFFENGKLNSDEIFVDGQTDGKVTVYYENGQKRYEGQNLNGKLSGVWNYWDEKGKLTRTVDYSKQAPGRNP